MHIGYPRTGTTSLQTFMFRQRRAFAQAGVFIPPMQHGIRHRLLQVLGAEEVPVHLARKLGLDDSTAPVAQAQDMLLGLGEAAQPYDAVFMSEETTAMRSAEELEALRDALRPVFERVRVIVCFREHESYLRSTYRHQISFTFNKESLGNFRARFLDADYLNYAKKMDTLCALFGRENVLPVRYNASATLSSNRHVVRMVAGAALADTFNLPDEAASMPASAVELKRVFNPILARMLTLNPGVPNGALHRLTRDYLGQLAEVADIAPAEPDMEDTATAAAFAEDWATLTTEYEDLFGKNNPKDAQQ